MSSNPKMEMGRAIIAAAYIAVGIILISHPGVTGIIIYRTAGGLEETDKVMYRGFWVGVYPGMTKEMLDEMALRIRESVK